VHFLRNVLVRTPKRSSEMVGAANWTIFGEYSAHLRVMLSDSRLWPGWSVDVGRGYGDRRGHH
jgi:hypothetical protein